MIDCDNRPVIMDFPQMRFAYESELYPRFSDLERDDVMDTEIACSGYKRTKDVDNELLEQMGIGLAVSDDEEDSAEIEEGPKHTEDDLDSLRQQVDASIQNDERTVPDVATRTAALTIDNDKTTKIEDEIPTLVPATDAVHNNTDRVDKLGEKGDQLDKLGEKGDQIDNKGDETAQNIADLDKNSQKYRLAMIEKALSDVRSMRSYTSASTIAPDVVKQQVKKNLVNVHKKMERKRAVAKGEASAVTRDRRDNRETIRESHGLWGWDE
ncbi:Serine/threonine-protein kinase rio2 (Rio kinase 2) [Operophtera brumata]|uniref:Serine/threonine-protein kinase rio2 (Rio kinase 2) n=1 Tax=Operophtera brumata TaxID=104452 RepID=A0A0L7LTK8_OPEBR|nr:Serine/threonine-protein kinase rio2 (Rio kinase 2) [Operophtera brumata]